jgi:lipopolysaccharide transport system ATP-binding protein
MNAIEVNNLTKAYRLYNSPRDRLREIISLRENKFHHEFYALNDVSFNVEKGQTVGIIGQNGSGKSTLLKIICGVLQPTGGSVQVNGRIAALLELGAGFNPEFTGRDNVYMNGALMGFSREEMYRRFPDIEAFAEIGEFIDQPVKTYSSGMLVRLAFAAAVNIDPEILVVDEALHVGDMYFQHRCISKLESFRTDGKTILIATHDINLVKNFCDTVALLSDGKILADGDPEYVTEQYLMLIRQKQTQHASSTFRVVQKTQTNLPGVKINFGSEAGQILGVRILDKEFRETAAFLAGDTIVIQIQLQVDPKVRRPSISFMLRDQRGYNIYGTDTTKLRLKLKLDENNQATVFFSLSPVLGPDSYSLAVYLVDFLTTEINMLLDKQVGVGAFQVIENKMKFRGVIDLHAQAFQDPNRVMRKSV